MSEIELLAPAGDFSTALAAFHAGADAVYLGLEAFSARAEAKNFTPEELRLIIAEARSLVPARKVYVTFNTLLDEADLPAAVEKLAVLAELGPDALIVQDLGVTRLVRRHFPSLAIHASTQLVAHNLEDVLALRDIGFSRVVLAREMTLEDIRSIAQRSGVELEVFVHGALCYALSGLCLFSAMEKNRSGNRGRCAYCCRLSYTDATGAKSLPFSMRDLRLDDCLAGLVDAGVASLKIEGRMKSSLYVASVTSYYRHLLDGTPGGPTRADLETVFSRRTTSLYMRGFDAKTEDVIDSVSLGHLGTPVGTLKHVTKDREGRTLLRFHTERALETHDGLAFLTPGGGVPFGFGIEMMRLALSRRPVFEVPAGSDVEIQVPDIRLAVLNRLSPELNPLIPGAVVYCSASNAMKRAFPVPSVRPSDLASGTPVDVTVTLCQDAITADASFGSSSVHASLAAQLTPAKNPDRTESAVRKAFERMGTTDWRLGELTISDPLRLFAPPSMLNEVRRIFVEKLDVARTNVRTDVVAAALKDVEISARSDDTTAIRRSDRILKLRLDQTPTKGTWLEVVVAIGHNKADDILARLPSHSSGQTVRLALPLFTKETEYNALRIVVKRLVKEGFLKWEAADLAGLRLLKTLGVADITADWTLYAFNSAAAAELSSAGVTRFVASPENNPDNLSALLGFSTPVEFLDVQTTPLFISLTRPAAKDPSLLTGIDGSTFSAYEVDGLWVTARLSPREFDPPQGAAFIRTDISWDRVKPQE